jgi:hypothetical protein
VITYQKYSQPEFLSIQFQLHAQFIRDSYVFYPNNRLYSLNHALDKFLNLSRVCWFQLYYYYYYYYIFIAVIVIIDHWENNGTRSHFTVVIVLHWLRLSVIFSVGWSKCWDNAFKQAATGPLQIPTDSLFPQVSDDSAIHNLLVGTGAFRKLHLTTRCQTHTERNPGTDWVRWSVLHTGELMQRIRK